MKGKRFMKKLIAILLACILIMLLLCSCSSNSNVDNDYSKTTTQITTEKTTETTTVTAEEKSVESSDEWIILTDSFGLEHPCLNISSDEFLDRVKKYSGYLNYSYYTTAPNNDAKTYVYKCEYNPPYSTNYTFVYIISNYKNTIENATIQGSYDAITNEDYGAYVEIIVATIYAFSNGEIDKASCAVTVADNLKKALSSQQSFYYGDYGINIHYNNDYLQMNIYKMK